MRGPRRSGAKVKQPRIRAIWLGRALQELRIEAGVVAKDVATHIYRDQGTVSRIEDGQIPVTEAILNGYFEICGVTDPHRRADLTVICRDAAQSGWWDGYKSDVAGILMDRTWLESKAISISNLDVNQVPGLLQTAEYAELLMRSVEPWRGDADVARFVELRMTRQHVLSRYKPVEFQTIIEQAVLTRSVGGVAVMREQLDRLLVESERSNIEIRVLPSDKYVGITGSFEVFELAAPYPEIAYIGTPSGDICVEGEAVDRLAGAYDRLLDASLDAEASRALIMAERDKL
ncbi:transcriptional regulator [Actinorhabdospora filicis]|uniref:Transcriptional regulator n=1 Tax=Actinorhabdospora filicis TaxID=1785913 RepID=A0A9W6WD70_9ACTN|nr:helix-turn-helix transcriptional regulator [Actinorhabdospora filicis]GLZ80525.1 transcriptional regulator [Actinorhabdospora filicis]